MSLKELAALLRSGQAEDGALAEYAAEYAREQKIFRKKDD
ncbi:hypothetical protein G443_002653 [Actinoalloteichus cyanogriseus DSM 43889]|uniref:Uncharacterized protein n=1 Tax=Actinoalloteichus caeruleus DSM 43889 TaxID=1120930 RepID=A0ABT1JJN0_ACTCY|nr:hypothetical protein [Actinoalloteichus caeruleus DSM 43889]